MAENFQAEVCGGNWLWQWNGLFSSSPCFSTSINIDNLGGGFGTCLLNPDLLDNKLAWSSDESAGSTSDSSIVIHQDKHHIIPTQQPNSSFDHHSSSQMSTNDWINPTLFHGNGSCEAMNQGQETEEQKASNYSSNIPQNSSPLSKNFSTYDYSSNLLQTLFETDPQTQQEPFYDTNNYQATINDFSRNSLINELSSSMENPKPTNLSTKTNTSNSSHVALNDFPISPFPSGPPFFAAAAAAAPRPSLPNFKVMIRNDEVQGLGTVTKKSSNCEPTFKRPRIETHTPLPTFKVRKEKMGDRITALQQLVSPFGKTDTASVLHEAIEYIKFLHDQVNALSTPYIKNGVTIQRLQDSDKLKEKGPDLKSRGLCLVPISSTFPVAAENTTDFWIPTFGGTFR